MRLVSMHLNLDINVVNMIIRILEARRNAGRLLANGDPLLGSLDWVLGIPPERRSGISINTISAAGEASSAVGTTSHPEEERLSDLLRLSNPYLEKRRRTFMMALSSAGIDWPPQRKCSRSPAADAGTTMSQAQGGGGSCVPNMDLLEMKEF
nr:hypothetical protein [Tanacetum cinerariifolium]